MLVRIAYKLLKLVLSRNLSLEERNLFTSLVLTKLDALPLADILNTDEEGHLLISGQPVDYDRARMLNEASRLALDNKAEKLVDDQVMWVATVNGLHNGDSPEKIYFYRAAIWWGQQRERLLRLLAGRQQEPDLE